MFFWPLWSVDGTFYNNRKIHISRYTDLLKVMNLKKRWAKKGSEDLLAMSQIFNEKIRKKSFFIDTLIERGPIYLIIWA